MAYEKIHSKELDGYTYNAELRHTMNGWHVNRNGYSTVFVPYSRSFLVGGVLRMATTIWEAIDIGIRMIELNDEAEKNYFKSHPELNP